MADIMNFTNGPLIPPWQNPIMPSTIFSLLLGFNIHYSNSRHRRPALAILNYLAECIPALLALRLVSRTTNRWVESARSLIWKNIQYTYPPSIDYLNTPNSVNFAALQKIKLQVRHLHLKIAPTNDLPNQFQTPVLNYILHIATLEEITISLLPDQPSTTSFLDLTIKDKVYNHLWNWQNHTVSSVKTMESSHHRPLIQLREALEASYSSLRELETLNFTNLSITGLEAFRCGPFTMHSTSDAGDDQWASRCFWRNLKHLNIRLIKWWDIDNPDSTDDTTSESSSLTNSRPFTPESSSSIQARPKICLPSTSRFNSSRQTRTKNYKYQGLRHLHDWLNEFKSDLHFLSFAWVRPQITTTLVCSKMSHRAILEGYAPSSYHESRTSFVPCSGPNPLLLDHTLDPRWFSHPKIVWEHIETLSIQGALVGEKEAGLLRERAKKLRVLKVGWGDVRGRVQYNVVEGGGDGTLIAAVVLGGNGIWGKDEKEGGMGLERAARKVKMMVVGKGRKKMMYVSRNGGRNAYEKI